MTTPDATVLEDTEHWFRGRGLPHFIADYSVTRDVLTRAVPLLALIFLIEVANAPKRTFPLWLDALAVAGGLAILLGVWMALNAIRHRRLLALPERVGAIEVAVFVLVPPAIPLIFGGQWRSALATAAVNVSLLALIYAVTSYGLVPTTRWALGETARELNSVVGLFMRALPLLVLFVTFIFLQNEAWQITADLTGPYYWIVLLLFPVVGVVFAVVRLPREIEPLSRFESWETLVSRVEGTPVETLVKHTARPLAATPALGRRQWGNIGLVVLFSQALQVVLVSAVLFAFLFVFGLLVVTEPIAEGFLGASPHVLASIDLWGRQLVITEELFRVTGFLTVFSAFYFAISVLTDDKYREEFFEEIMSEMRRSLAVRAVYLVAREEPPTSPAHPPDPSTTLSPT